MHDICADTQRATIEDRYIELTKHFKYLGSHISYNLKDDYEIEQRATKAYQNMGMLKYFWEMSM